MKTSYYHISRYDYPPQDDFQKTPESVQKYLASLVQELQLLNREVELLQHTLRSITDAVSARDRKIMSLIYGLELKDENQNR